MWWGLMRHASKQAGANQTGILRSEGEEHCPNQNSPASIGPNQNQLSTLTQRMQSGNSHTHRPFHNKNSVNPSSKNEINAGCSNKRGAMTAKTRVVEANGNQSRSCGLRMESKMAAKPAINRDLKITSPVPSSKR